MQTLIKAIAVHSGISVQQYEEVHGGDINECYCLYGQSSNYFLKLNHAGRFPGMFEMEADGLEALRHSSALMVPQVIKQGIEKDQQWLLLQWMKKESPAKNSLQNFGAGLAAMHRQTQPYFGWHGNNYIGSLQQVNIQHSNWAGFYTQCRIMPLVKMLFNTGAFSKTDIAVTASFCKKAGNIFPPEPPSLLHGDLWGGNYMITTGGHAAIFDPAVYYGHREMDMGMTKLFGGFPQIFYDAYNEVYPMEKGWQQRLSVTQLYPLLVHAVLFGGHYEQSAREIIMNADRI
ncbi:MAG: fructosamine kinase family protein [Chitinophagaceae bacterium]